MEEVKIDFDDIKRRLNNPSIGYVEASGVYMDVAEPGHARLVMPLGSMHLNHVGIAYAGSMFVLGELMTAAILYCTYGVGVYIPIASEHTIKFLRPTKSDLVCDMRISPEEAEALIAPVRERGKGKITLEIPITDVTGADIAKLTAVVYLMPPGASL